MNIGIRALIQGIQNYAQIIVLHNYTLFQAIRMDENISIV